MIYNLINPIIFIFCQIVDLGNQKYIMVIKSAQNSTFQISIEK